MIDITKTYRTRNGFPVTLFSDTFRHDNGNEVVFKIVGVVHQKDSDIVIGWDKNGSIDFRQGQYDLVEYDPFMHLKPDQKLMVSNDPITPENPGYPAYFHSVAPDRKSIRTHVDGRTSFTNLSGMIMTWNFFKTVD